MEHTSTDRLSDNVPDSQPAPLQTRPGTPQLSSKGLTIALLAAVVLTMAAITAVTSWLGKPTEPTLPVAVTFERQLVDVREGRAKVLAPVVVVTNQSDSPIANVSMDINGQYYLYRDSPLQPSEPVAIPLQVFATKSNQRFNPKLYPIDQFTVYGRLPSGRRGIYETEPHWRDE